MSDTDSTTAAESPEPFTGDRGWKGLERSEGEGAFFAIVAALLVVALLALVLTGVAGLGLIFVILTFVVLGALMLITIGQ